MKLSILCLSLFLGGCGDFPTILPQERCFVVLDELSVIIEGVSYSSGHCRCHMYEWTESHIGRITESVNHELNYCDKMGGYNPQSTANIFTWQEEIRLWLKRKQKKYSDLKTNTKLSF